MTEELHELLYELDICFSDNEETIKEINRKLKACDLMQEILFKKLGTEVTYNPEAEAQADWDRWNKARELLIK